MEKPTHLHFLLQIWFKFTFGWKSGFCHSFFVSLLPPCFSLFLFFLPSFSFVFLYFPAVHPSLYYLSCLLFILCLIHLFSFHLFLPSFSPFFPSSLSSPQTHSSVKSITAADLLLCNLNVILMRYKIKKRSKLNGKN